MVTCFAASTPTPPPPHADRGQRVSGMHNTLNNGRFLTSGHSPVKTFNCGPVEIYNNNQYLDMHVHCTWMLFKLCLRQMWTILSLTRSHTDFYTLQHYRHKLEL